MGTLPGGTRPETQARELAYWTADGLRRWDPTARRYRHLFPFEAIAWDAGPVLDVGSGPLSVFEGIAPASAEVHPCDVLAEAYNRLAPDKRFPVRGELPPGPYALITLLNMLDHMDRPDELLAHLAARLAPSGEVWIYCHVDRPFDAAEHPQKFRFWRLVRMVSRHFAIRRCGLVREGRLFPYAWWAVCGPLGGAGRVPLHVARCGATYARFHAERALVKAAKLAGFRRWLPRELQF